MWFIGDIVINGLIADQPEKNTERFRSVKSFFSDKRFLFANLESPLFEDGSQNKSKKQIHTTSKKAIDVLKDINVFGVSLANNHIFDCSEKGLKSTIKWLSENNIQHTGAGFSKKDLEPIIFINDQSEKVAFFSYVDENTNPHFRESKNCYINILNLKTIKKDIQKYKKSCDRLIISLHWGIDYIQYVSKDQVETAKEIIDFGADLIIGHHSHVIQPHIEYRKKHIFFGLGGLVFGDFKTKKGMESSFQKTKKGLILNVNQEHLKIFKSTDNRGNIITINLSNNHLKKNKKLWNINKFFIRNEKLFFCYRKIELFRIKIYHFFFAFQNNPFNRLFKKLKND